VVIDPKQARTSEVAPLAVIEEVLADGRPVVPLSRLAPGRARDLQIRYTANSFLDPRRTRFQYRLVHHDADWREETLDRLAVYTNLRPGDYRFELRAANAHGVWSEATAVFAFSLAPQVWQTWPFWVGSAVGASLLMWFLHHRRIAFLRRLERLERAQAVETERTRIAQDLHDDLGANLTGLALKLDLAQRQAPESVSGQIKSLAGHARGMVDAMRETVWTLNPRHDTLESFAGFIAKQAEQSANSAGLRLRLKLPERLPNITIPGSIRHHLFLAIKEALSNAAKHANATEIHLDLWAEDDRLCLTVVDDGRGFVAPLLNSRVQPSSFGNGLANMRQRVAALGGELEITSTPRQGTKINVRVPMKLFRQETP